MDRKQKIVPSLPCTQVGYHGPVLEPGLGAGHDGECLVARLWSMRSTWEPLPVGSPPAGGGQIGRVQRHSGGNRWQGASSSEVEYHLSGGQGAGAWGLEIPTRYSRAHLDSRPTAQIPVQRQSTLFGVISRGTGQCSLWGFPGPPGWLQYSRWQRQWDLEGCGWEDGSVLLLDFCVFGLLVTDCPSTWHQDTLGRSLTSVQRGWCPADLQHAFRWGSGARPPGDGLSYLRGWSCWGG